MKKIIILCTTWIAAMSFTGKATAQLSEKFTEEIRVLVPAKTSEIKGKEIESKEGFTTYASKLKLTGFDISYTTSLLGNVLKAKYLQKGTDDIMEDIKMRFLETKYIAKDSKQYPKILGTGMMAENLKRKIKLLDISDMNNPVTVLIVDQGKDDTILITFLNKD